MDKGKEMTLKDSIREWWWKWGFEHAKNYNYGVYYHHLWKLCPVSCKEDTFRRIMCQLALENENWMGQKRGYYWVY